MTEILKILNKFTNSNILSIGQANSLNRLINKTDRIASQLSGHVSNNLAPTYLSPIVVKGGRNSRRHRKSRRHKKSRRY